MTKTKETKTIELYDGYFAIVNTRNFILFKKYKSNHRMAKNETTISRIGYFTSLNEALAAMGKDLMKNTFEKENDELIAATLEEYIRREITVLDELKSWSEKTAQAISPKEESDATAIHQG